MRCARPSTIAVLPTPGSPISTGLFLVRRCSTWMVRRISSSRPITGSSLPRFGARGQVDAVFFQRLALLLGVFTLHLFAATQFLDRRFQMRFRGAGRLQRRAQFAFVLQRREHEQLAGDELVAALLREFVGEIEQPGQLVAGMDVAFLPTDFRQPLEHVVDALPQRRHVDLQPGSASGAVEPPCWPSNAAITCTGSSMLLSRPTASDCASASACWKREVSLSIRISEIPARGKGFGGHAATTRKDADSGGRFKQMA